MKNIRSLNKAAKQHGLQLIQGNGYLYWIALTDEIQAKINELSTTSVVVNKFSDLSFENWLIELKDFKETLDVITPIKYEFKSFTVS